MRALAAEATVYGLPSVYQYAQMIGQAVDESSPSYTGFNRWYHQRDVATPEFRVFKTPNVDTLYSNAWLDLSEGPVRVRVPRSGTAITRFTSSTPSRIQPTSVRGPWGRRAATSS